MNNPGVYALAVLHIMAPKALVLLTPVIGMVGMKSANLLAALEGFPSYE